MTLNKVLILAGAISLVVACVYLATVLSAPPRHPMIGLVAPGVPDKDPLTVCVFAPGCPHCVEVAPYWAILGGRVLGVSLGTPEATRAFMVETGLTFPVIEVTQDFINDYHIESTPTTILISEGIIQGVIVGVPDSASFDVMAKFQKELRR